MALSPVTAVLYPQIKYLFCEESYKDTLQQLILPSPTSPFSYQQCVSGNFHPLLMWEKAQSCKAVFWEGEKKIYCRFRNTMKSSIWLESRNEMKFWRSGNKKGQQRARAAIRTNALVNQLLGEGGRRVVVYHQLKFLPPSSLLLASTDWEFGRVLAKERI